MMREKLFREAERLIGTNYHHQGRDPEGLGVDCAGLVIAALLRAGWEPRRAETLAMQDYRRIPDGVMLRDYVLGECEEIAKPDAIAGDLVLFAFGSDPQHLAVIVPTPEGLTGTYLVHAVNGRGVVKHRYATEWRNRTVGFFRVLGIDEN
jgi:cell wall-associated NlpC family hydrolase